MTKGVAMANKKLVNLLLQDENANVANEEFETLSGNNWVRLLSAKPQFADSVSQFKCICIKQVSINTHLINLISLIGVFVANACSFFNVRRKIKQKLLKLQYY